MEGFYSPQSIFLAHISTQTKSTPKTPTHKSILARIQTRTKATPTTHSHAPTMKVEKMMPQAHNPPTHPHAQTQKPHPSHPASKHLP